MLPNYLLICTTQYSSQMGLFQLKLIENKQNKKFTSLFTLVNISRLHSYLWLVDTSWPKQVQNTSIITENSTGHHQFRKTIQIPILLSKI